MNTRVLAEFVPVPKKHVSPVDDVVPDADAPSVLAGWQATGLCLAAASAAALHGLGTLLGAVLVAPVIYALVRLSRHAPSAGSTAGLVGSTLGPRAAAFTRATQVSGYALLAIAGAQGIGFSVLPKEVSDDPSASLPLILNPWLWSLYAITALVVAAVLTFALPGRVIASIAAILAAAGLLIVVNYGLAVIARTFADTVPGQDRLDEYPTALDGSSTLVVLAVGLAGFEVVTAARTRRGGSAGWPMALAVAAITACAAVTWWAAQSAAPDQSPLDGRYLALTVFDLYGSTGMTLFTVGVVMLVLAGVFALLWGLAQLTSDRAFIAVVAAMAALTLVLTVLELNPSYAAALVLVAMYAVVLVANARIPGDSVITWWLRIVMPIVGVAIVLLPLLDAGFTLGSLKAVVFAAGVLAVAAAVALAGHRRPAG